MNRGDDDSSPPYATTYHHEGPYNPSIASSASSSSSSVWSSVSSQSSETSDDSSVHSTSISADSEISDSYCYSSQPSYQPTSCDQGIAPTIRWPSTANGSVVPEHRPNPRRTSAASRSGCPPSLVRQSDRKVNFVDSLVDSSAQIVEAIWPLSSVACRDETTLKGVLPLRTFIQETLRRSRTSYSTLQVALYYLILIKPHIPKHDFTMEQPEDTHPIRALQCGRRMFLSALILASKYLQDRNYSARAWSKISGLNTAEINQNEMAFLIAVNWRLHITDAVFQRWTDIVLKYTPTQPPSSGACSVRTQSELSAGWKAIILKLNPELDNIDGIVPAATAKAAVRNISVSCTKLVVERGLNFESTSNESTPTPRYYAPQVLEPTLPTAYPASKPAPAFGLLPTPRLTPQSIGYNTPAVSAASYILGKSSMGLAMQQYSTACTAQASEKWTSQATPSPQAYALGRRSSLAYSVSSMSSPESMVSDSSSRCSRSSSISSASSLISAPLSSKLDVQARCRYAKQCSERQNLRLAPVIVNENYSDSETTSSPESYTGPVGKDFLDLSLSTPVGRKNREIDFFASAKDAAAARTLQELHNNPRADAYSPTKKSGAKRSRPVSGDHQSLQDTVRDLLSPQSSFSSQKGWESSLVRPRLENRTISYDCVPSTVCSVSRGADNRKRVCCAAEYVDNFQGPSLRPGPGMWADVL